MLLLLQFEEVERGRFFVFWLILLFIGCSIRCFLLLAVGYTPATSTADEEDEEDDTPAGPIVIPTWLGVFLCEILRDSTYDGSLWDDAVLLFVLLFSSFWLGLL